MDEWPTAPTGGRFLRDPETGALTPLPADWAPEQSQPAEAVAEAPEQEQDE